MSKKHDSQVLSPSQLQFLEQLHFIKKRGWYLAGGTALALQLKHRRSFDFVFYTQGHFRKGTLVKLFRVNMPQWQIKVTRDINDTFELNAQPDIYLSCFYYDYPLLQNPVNVSAVRVAALPDIAAMKMVAIAQRGTRRDFIDIYYLLQHYTLEEILRFTEAKYLEFDIYHGLRGLLYFKDADEDKAVGRALVFDRKLTWTKVKQHLIAVIGNFQRTFSRG